MTPIPHATLVATYTREQPYRHHWPAEPERGLADPAIRAIVETIARHVPAFGRRRADRARAGMPTRQIPLQCAACRDTGWIVVSSVETVEGGPRVNTRTPCGCQGPRPATRVEPASPPQHARRKAVGLDFKSLAAGEREDE